MSESHACAVVTVADLAALGEAMRELDAYVEALDQARPSPMTKSARELSLAVLAKLASMERRVVMVSSSYPSSG